MPLQWTEDLSVYIEEIDSQHKELFDRISKLHDTMRQGKGKEEIGKVFKFLEDYIIVHFGTEERYMIQYKYLDVEFHNAQHRRFSEDFTLLKKGFEKAAADIIITLYGASSLLGAWWTDHISKVDKALGAFLKAKI